MRLTLLADTYASYLFPVDGIAVGTQNLENIVFVAFKLLIVPLDSDAFVICLLRIDVKSIDGELACYLRCYAAHKSLYALAVRHTCRNEGHLIHIVGVVVWYVVGVFVRLDA